MEQISDGKKVCVTGGSGFIASWLVKLLLERGYIVNATVRNPNDRAKTKHLLGFDGAKERLHLFGANLMEEGSFDTAIHGCDGVFHVASPVIIASPNAQGEVIDPAVKGTLNVLASCAKSSSVKQVVLTSSTAAIEHNGTPLTSDTIVDETWFSTEEGCKGKAGECYLLSKTLAEQAAWKFAKENGIDMVSINPAAVIGPILQSTINRTSYFIANLINGSGTYPNACYGWVHVKDVAEAHIRAFEIPSANGRYVMSESVAHFSDIVTILRELYPTLKLPNRCVDDDQSLQPTHKIRSDKVKALGIEYIPLKTALKETVECLKEKFKIGV